MTAKLDGTNGLLQQYDYQVLTTAFTYTFAAGTTVLVINPAGTLATGTITMPAAPADGMTITVESTQQVTALTMSGNGGTVVGPAIQLIPNQPLSWVYRLTNTSWYPLFGGAGRATALVSGTSVASTSGTSIGFTALPSWVKRITVQLQGVAVSATSTLIVQLGTGATPTYTTTGYISSGNLAANAASNAVSSDTSSFIIMDLTTASLVSGVITITNINSNSWVENFNLKRTAGSTGSGAGDVSLGAVLTAVRVTTFAGTATFTAGTINILYE